MTPWPDHTICTNCGYPVLNQDVRGHVCDPERVVDFNLKKMRPEIDGFEHDYQVWLTTPAGKFEMYDADRRHV